MGGLAPQRPPLIHYGNWGALLPCLSSGTGSKTFFRLRTDCYQGEMEKRSMAVSQDLGGWCGV